MKKADVPASESSTVRMRGRTPSAPPSTPPGPASACFVVMTGGMLGRRIELAQSTVTIGRLPGSAVHVDEDDVSRRHARALRQESGDYVLEDLDSTNGTMVNDVTVRRALLQHGDIVQVGRTFLKYLAPGHVESAYFEVLYRAMSEDALTSLRNRKSFDEAMQREIERARQYTRPLSLLLLDVDHFKKINDTHGHLAGDMILRQLGLMLRRTIRRDDIAGRVGGEEFAILLPEIALDGATLVAHKILEMVAATPFRTGRNELHVTVSIGAAERQDDAESGESLYKRADQLLYAAKASGRNRVVADAARP